MGGGGVVSREPDKGSGGGGRERQRERGLERVLVIH